MKTTVDLPDDLFIAARGAIEAALNNAPGGWGITLPSVAEFFSMTHDGGFVKIPGLAIRDPLNR